MLGNVVKEIGDGIQTFLQSSEFEHFFLFNGYLNGTTFLIARLPDTYFRGMSTAEKWFYVCLNVSINLLSIVLTQVRHKVYLSSTFLHSWIHFSFNIFKF